MIVTFTAAPTSIEILPTVSERQVRGCPRRAVSTSRCRLPAAGPPGPANPGRSSKERTLCLELSRSPVTRPALPPWRLRTDSYSVNKSKKVGQIETAWIVITSVQNAWSNASN